MSKLNFKVSSNLKNIIGKDLINDKYVAIFELVKNSYDAGSTKVDIRFENLGKPNQSIVISDNGSGMTRDDIINKWLFLAYSEKKTRNIDKNSFRDKIKRNYAGAKGVGRFSCDRLGQFLNITTGVENEPFGHSLDVDWSQFEIDDKDEFINIDVDYNQIEKPKDMTKGTKLTISGLREDWSREELLRLKRALMKLSSPFKESTEFIMEIFADRELESDKNTNVGENDFNYSMVNGIIINDIISKIDAKTTSISVIISPDGKEIKTELTDRGIFVFNFTEKNIKYTELKDIEFKISYLNRSAKSSFTRQMGVEAVNYGSIFVYKNEIRIYPYGEPGLDFFGVNLRKAQGYARFFGTREMMGYIRILGNSEYFNETSSRDGGFVRNQSVIELEDFFEDKVLKVLEKYVVKGVSWGEVSEPDGVKIELTPYDAKTEIITQFSDLTRLDSVLEAEINPDLLDKPTVTSESKMKTTINSLKKAATKFDNPDLEKVAENLSKQLDKLVKDKEIAEATVEVKQKQLNVAEREIETRKHQAEILEKTVDKDVDYLLNGYHLIQKNTIIITSKINQLLTFEVSDDIKRLLGSILYSNMRNKHISEIRLNSKTSYYNGHPYDLVKFIPELLNENMIGSSTLESMKLIYDFKVTAALTTYSSDDLAAIFDNLISNSNKAKAKTLTITLDKNSEGIIIEFLDDGKGLSKNIIDSSSIFDRNYSTTFGTGFGLNHVKKLLESNNEGSISYIPTEIGFKLRMVIKNVK